MISESTISSRPITGVMMNYFHVCHTELWYFAHDMEMEHTSDLVHLGRLVHEESYERDSREIWQAESAMFGGATFKLDRITADGVIHEIKKSDRAEEAHIWQLKYYLYLLREQGIGDIKGVLEFPTQRRRIEIELTAADSELLQGKIAGIRKVISSPQPPKAQKIPFCRRCSYRELCWG